MGDVAQTVSDKSGDQADTELQDEGFGRIDHIDGIEKVTDGHSDGATDAAVQAAQNQRAQHADRVSQVDRSGIASGKADLNLQEGEHHIGQGGEYARHNQLLNLLISHNSPPF